MGRMPNRREFLAALAASAAAGAAWRLPAAEPAPGREVMPLVDFNGPSLPVNKAGAAYPNQYGPEGTAEVALDAADAVVGRSVRFEVSRGLLYAQFNAHNADGTRGFAREYAFYCEPRPENDQQVYSLAATYVPRENRLILTWSRNKNDNAVRHEVRYGFADLHAGGSLLHTSSGSFTTLVRWRPGVHAGSGVANYRVYRYPEPHSWGFKSNGFSHRRTKGLKPTRWRSLVNEASETQTVSVATEPGVNAGPLGTQGP